ncbi:HNH endonuclease signature motif containing protein [Nocardioides sp. LHG3406-4]|uniref:HNH endonuclease signature motif containing protein n=1 Tax=Nocardioides sp. LHG3406-4 TaxID=2804575 RepID=UPI003CECD475
MAISTSELPDIASAVLAFARSRRQMADRAEAELLVAACEWADLHPAESVSDAAAFTVPGGGEHEEPVAGPGAPLVAEFCIPEFGAVLDLHQPIVCDGYQPSARLREQVILRDRTCVFPWCTRPARGCDLDHIVPREHGGPTSTANLAALCRRHHRLKTHSAWTYVRTGPAAYTWTSPHGHTYVRDPAGTEPG